MLPLIAIEFENLFSLLVHIVSMLLPEDILKDVQAKMMPELEKLRQELTDKNDKLESDVRHALELRPELE